MVIDDSASTCTDRSKSSPLVHSLQLLCCSFEARGFLEIFSWFLDTPVRVISFFFKYLWFRYWPGGLMVQFAIDTGSFSEGGFGPPKLIRMVLMMMISYNEDCGVGWRNKTQSKQQTRVRWGIQQLHPVLPLAWRLYLYWCCICVCIIFVLVWVSLFCCWYPYHLARTPKVKSPKRGPPTTPNIVREA